MGMESSACTFLSSCFVDFRDRINPQKLKTFTSLSCIELRRTRLKGVQIRSANCRSRCTLAAEQQLTDVAQGGERNCDRQQVIDARDHAEVTSPCRRRRRVSPPAHPVRADARRGGQQLDGAHLFGQEERAGAFATTTTAGTDGKACGLTPEQGAHRAQKDRAHRTDAREKN